MGSLNFIPDEVQQTTQINVGMVENMAVSLKDTVCWLKEIKNENTNVEGLVLETDVSLKNNLNNDDDIITINNRLECEVNGIRNIFYNNRN